MRYEKTVVLMQQQINLYRLLPREDKLRFTKKTLVICYSVFFFLLLTNFFYLEWSNYRLANNLTQKNSELSNRQQQLISLTQQYPLLD